MLSYAPTSQQWQELASTAGRVRELAEFQTDYWRYRDEYDRAACGAAAYWQAVARRPLDPRTLGKLIELDNEQWTRVNPEMLALGAPLAQGRREDGNSVEHGVRDARRHGGEVRLAERIRREDFFLQGAVWQSRGRKFFCTLPRNSGRARLAPCLWTISSGTSTARGGPECRLSCSMLRKSSLELEHLLLEKGLLREMDEAVGVRR